MNNSKLIYDLETMGVDPKTGKIRRYGFYSYKTKQVHIFYPKDKDDVQKMLLDHQTLIGFNNQEFDDLFLMNNRIKFCPRWNLDLMKIVEIKQSIMPYKIEAFGLDYLCELFRLGRKLDFDYSVLDKEPEECTAEENSYIDEYLERDILITKQLYEFLVKQFDIYKEYLNNKEVENNLHLLIDPPTYCYKVICKISGLEEKYNHNIKHGSLKGGYVIQAKEEKYLGPIVVLDFKSAYTHANMMQNLFTMATIEEIKNKDYYKGNHICSLSGRYNNKKMGKIEECLKFMFKKRAELKRLKDPRQHSYKTNINIFYGICGNPKFESVYNLVAANDCTKTVRSWIKFAVKTFEEHGYKVLYGDTDSDFIYDPFNDLPRLMKVKDIIINEIKANVPFPQDTFDLDYEKTLKVLFFFPIKDKKGIRQKKKNYMYVDMDDKLTVKGLPVIKLTAAPVSKRIFEDLKLHIIRRLDCKFKRKSIQTLIHKYIKSGGYDMVSRNFRIFLGKKYKSTTSIQSQILETYGYGNHKLIKNTKVGVGKGVKYCTIEEAKEAKLTFNDLDLDNVWNELKPFLKEEKTGLTKWGVNNE